MPVDEIIFTTHAKIRGAERGITEDHFKAVALNPTTKQPQGRGTNGGLRYLLGRKIGERKLLISVEIFKSKCFVLTGYWEPESKLKE